MIHGSEMMGIWLGIIFYWWLPRSSPISAKSSPLTNWDLADRQIKKLTGRLKKLAKYLSINWAVLILAWAGNATLVPCLQIKFQLTMECPDVSKRFENHVPKDEPYKYPIFKWLSMTKPWWKCTRKFVPRIDTRAKELFINIELE